MYNTNLHEFDDVEADVDANGRGKLHGIRVGLMFLMGLWSISALAASGPACDNSGDRLQTLSVSMEALAAEPVELVNADTAASNPAQPVNQAVAPLLYLAPHIAALLHSVFEGTGAALVEEAESEASKPSPTVSAPPVPSADVDDSTTLSNPVFRNDDIARFQRQMYRKDI